MVRTTITVPAGMLKPVAAGALSRALLMRCGGGPDGSDVLLCPGFEAARPPWGSGLGRFPSVLAFTSTGDCESAELAAPELSVGTCATGDLRLNIRIASKITAAPAMTAA